MRSRIHVLTLGVTDLERSLAFYRALGFESEGIIETEFPGGTAAMFELEDGLILALYGRNDLEQDANISLSSSPESSASDTWSQAGKKSTGCSRSPRPPVPR